MIMIGVVSCQSSGVQTMKVGCNQIELIGAKVDFLVASNRLEQAEMNSNTTPDVLNKLRNEYAVAKRRYDFWDADVRKRGHQHSVPEHKDAISPPESTSSRGSVQR